MNNFEKIKTLSVEEMAEVLHRGANKICFETCNITTGNQFRCPFGDMYEASKCVECIKKWLLEEVK